MKKILIGIMMFYAFGSILYSEDNTCTTEWIQQENRKYRPPSNLKILHISFVDELDGVELKTQNRTSYYVYKSFLDIDGRLGISYTATNGNILDLFQDGVLMIWQGNTPLLKANCLTLKLDIGKVK